MTDDDTDWEIDELLSQIPHPSNGCPQIIISKIPERYIFGVLDPLNNLN